MRKPRIAVVGSINADLVVRGHRLPGPGETVVGGQFLMAGGGKGANQAVALARLGAEVALVARVGQDVFGHTALASLRREGIDTRFVLEDSEHATGVALILVDEHAENLISVASGANLALGMEDVWKAEAVIRKADLLMLQLEVPLPTVAFAARMAKEAGIPVILNPAPAQALDGALLACVDWLTPNEHEAEMLTGRPVRNEAEAWRAAEHLVGQGVRNVVITLGSRGALVCTREDRWVEPACLVEAVDTTAAGDAFNAGLGCALARSASIREAMAYASRVGALSVTRSGAQPSLPTEAEVANFHPSCIA